MKVWTLMQTPAADGLFHKGVVQSGCIDHFVSGNSTEQNGKAIVTALLAELKLDDVKALETIPYAQLAAAYNKVAPEVAKTGAYVGGNPLANDWYLGDPLEVGFTEHAKTIPVMVGTVLGEFSFMPALSEEEKADAALIDSMIEKRYGRQRRAVHGFHLPRAVYRFHLEKSAAPGKRHVFVYDDLHLPV